MKNSENLLKFEDFDKNWKSKEQKKTKRTETGLDIIEEKRKLKSLREKIDIEEDETIDNIDIDVDDVDVDWQEQLKTLINEIIENGEDAKEVYDFIEDYMKNEYDIDDDETDEDEDDDFDDDFNDIDKQDLKDEDEEEFEDDDEEGSEDEDSEDEDDK